ncbi:unnamed protein product [Meloidogyne enterolobii]|uniref:Uncharacterized protein n=1 Tax=Meloidogyne enterolobii TaxID=390850 RepID=A0ACB0Y8D2_MELEN
MSIPKTILNILVFVVIVLNLVDCMRNKGKTPEEVPSLPNKPSSKKFLNLGGPGKDKQQSGLKIEVPEKVQVPLLQNKPSKKFLRKTQSSIAEGKQQMLSPKSHPLYRTKSEPESHGYTSLNSPGSPLNKSPLKRQASQSSTRIGYLTTTCGDCIDGVVNCIETCKGTGKPEGYTSDDPEVVDARLREIKENENVQILF